MNHRFRIKLLSFVGLALLTFLNGPAFAQNRGGGGGGGGGGNRGNSDPTAQYIKQLKLEGKSKAAFQKAFRNNTKNVQKWSAKVQKFQRNNQKYVGKPPPAPAIIEKIKTDRAELEAEQKSNAAAYKEALEAFLSPQQLKKFGAVSQQIAEQRKKAAERRAANQQKQDGGKKKK